MRARAQALSEGLSAAMTSDEMTTLPPPPPDHQRYSRMLPPDTRSEVMVGTPTPGSSAARPQFERRNRDRSEVRIRSSRRDSRLSEDLELLSRAASSHSSRYKANPIPWSTIQIVQPTRRKESRRPDKALVSLRPPIAGR